VTVSGEFTVVTKDTPYPRSAHWHGVGNPE